jgi:hypothetical protein
VRNKNYTQKYYVEDPLERKPPLWKHGRGVENNIIMDLTGLGILS